jgi:hypothetical protein
VALGSKVNESSGSLMREFLGQLNKYMLLNEDPTSVELVISANMKVS